jgi:hypothetical protein
MFNKKSNRDEKGKLQETVRRKAMGLYHIFVDGSRLPS